MQSITPVTADQLLAAGQIPLMKFEIYVDGVWKKLSDAPIERLTDGGLEEWLDANDLEYWTEFGTGGTVNREASEIHGGSFSCRLWTERSGHFVGFYQDFTLTPGSACKITIWYLRTAHESSDLRLYFFDIGENVSLKDDGTWKVGGGAFLIPLTTTEVWKKFELEFTAHPDYSDYRIRFYKGHGAGGEVSYYIDDVSVKERIEGIDKNYLESVSISLGGASKTPNPVAGVWSAMLSNKDSIFHPQHPNSLFKNYLKTERKVRISIGAKYNETNYYWQRVIGYMDEPRFSMPDFKVNISGGDYMKLFEDTELKKPDNYWGSSVTLSTIAAEETLGDEMYNEADVMDILNEVNTVASWDRLYGAAIGSVADAGGGSTWVGEIVKDNVGGFNMGYTEDNNIDTVEQGKKYKVVFKYRIIVGWNLSVGIYKTGTPWTPDTPKVVGDTVEPTVGKENNCFYVCTVAGTTGALEPDWPTVENGGIAGDGDVTWATKYMDGKKMGEITDLTSDVTPYVEESFYFTATETCAIKMRLSVKGPGHVATQVRVDVISIKEITGFSNASYNLPDECLGPYYVTLDGEPIYYRNEGKGWYYEEDINRLFIEDGRTLDAGQSLKIYYFTLQIPENIVADLLVTVGLYANQGAALAGMEYTATGITIDNVWFDVGSSCLNAIRMLCERCDYRFHFKYDGTPVFKPKPAPVATSFTFINPKHIASAITYQDRNEIKNRIVIEGMKQAEPVGKEETMPSELKGEEHDDDSITAYGERTLTIKNHLFQTQASIDAMCITLLAEYKDPKWYSDLEMPFLPVPLEVGDKIQWEERLSPVLDITQTGVIRDIKIDSYNTTYICEHAPLFFDPFDDAIRAPTWTDEPNNGTIVESGDVLTLAVANGVNGDWWAGSELCPFAKLSPEAGKLTVITKLNSYAVNDKTNAGLLIGSTTAIPDGAGGHCFAFCRVRDDDTIPAQDGLCVFDIGKAGVLAYVAVTTLPIWLRMVIDGSGAGATIDFDYSTDGIDWTTLHTENNLTWSIIGLYVKSWAYLNGISAPFEFFRIDKF